MKPESVNMDLSHHNMVKNEPRSLGANSQTFWISGISHLRVEVFNLYTAPSVDGEDQAFISPLIVTFDPQATEGGGGTATASNNDESQTATRQSSSKTNFCGKKTYIK